MYRWQNRIAQCGKVAIISSVVDVEGTFMKINPESIIKHYGIVE